MAGDRTSEVLVAALKQALSDPVEQRLYRSGKLAGLFPGRSGASGDAAAAALRDGLLELVRTETRGKTVVEWVRLTPRGVDHLHKQQSPAVLLEELRAALHAARDGLPGWLRELQQQVQQVAARLDEETERMRQRVGALAERVEATLKRLEDAAGVLPEAVTRTVPWAKDALSYLERRKTTEAPGECPLPELFAALAGGLPGLTVTAFHDGLRHLQDFRALKLLPWQANGEELAQPEYALPDGARLLYYAAR